MEVDKTEAVKKERNDVVLQISSMDNPFNSSVSATSPEISNESVPKRVLLARSEFSKPKSRLVEPPVPMEAVTSFSSAVSKVNVTSNVENSKLSSVTSKTRLIALPGDVNFEEEDEKDDELYRTASIEASKKIKGKRLKVTTLIELTAFVCFMGFFIASLVINRLRNSMIWGLEIWKWCVLIIVIFCGRLVTAWVMNVTLFLIEKNSLFRKKVLYFVYGVRTSVQVFIWLGLVLLTWTLLINRGVSRSKHTAKVLNQITRALAAFLVGAFIWLVKTFALKLFASSFHVKRFFDRIQESVFHQYVLHALSGPPLMDLLSTRDNNSELAPGKLGCLNLKKRIKTVKKENEKGNEQSIENIKKLRSMKSETISPWTMKQLINVISGSELSAFSSLDLNADEEDGKKNTEITCEWEAKGAAYQIFQNVARPGIKYIEEDDLLRFMKKEDVHSLLPLFVGFAETRKIKRKTLKNWLVNVYIERKSLAHSLNDTKTAIEELSRILSAILFVVLIVVWLLVMEFLSTQVLVFISSQLLLVAFMFGNTAKMVFEAMIFVFVMHPFDVADRCVIDGVQMIVEEMNILTTVFLRYDNEKIFYPNSVLATKPISNFYRSPEMGDSVEFSVAASTSIETIGSLKARIKTYLESKPQHWRPGHSVVVKEIEDVNKMKMALYITHTINFQNYGDKTSRRSELVLEMKKYFEELGIKYHLLPQEIHLTYLESTTARFPPPTRSY